jgi:hypothetical protein
MRCLVYHELELKSVWNVPAIAQPIEALGGLKGVSVSLAAEPLIGNVIDR